MWNKRGNMCVLIFILAFLWESWVICPMQKLQYPVILTGRGEISTDERNMRSVAWSFLADPWKRRIWVLPPLCCLEFEYWLSNNQSSWTATWPDWKSGVTEQKDRRICVLMMLYTHTTSSGSLPWVSVKWKNKIWEFKLLCSGL